MNFQRVRRVTYEALGRADGSHTLPFTTFVPKNMKVISVLAKIIPTVL